MIVYAKESYNIVGAAFEVYNKMGHGFLEAVYQECLELEFKKRGIPYELEKNIKIYYDGHELKQSYRADFVCYDKIIVELKAVSAKVKKQMSHADRVNARLALILGDEEVAARAATVKILSSGEQETVPESDLAAFIKQHI